MNDLKMTNEDNEFTCPIVELDDGDLAIEFSDELMEALDLKVGDVLQWDLIEENGSWILNKLNKVGEENEEG